MPVTTRSQAKLQEPRPGTSTVAQGPNPFATYDIIKRMGRLASQADLAKLNGINSSYYAILKSDQLDAAERTIVFRHLDLYSLVQDERKLITKENWKTEFAQIYKKIEIKSLLFLGTLRDWADQLANARSVLEDVRPYITDAKLSKIGIGNIDGFDFINVPTTGASIAEFLVQFPNLKQLELTLENNINVFSQTELEDLLGKLSEHSRIQTTLKLEVKTDDDERDNAYQLDSVMIFPNIKLKLDYYKHIFEDDLEDIVSIYHRYGARIDGITLQDLSIENQTDVTHLNQLSPIVTKLDIQISRHFLGDVFEDGNAWPNLRRLDLTWYKSPLDVLKQCPQLEILGLTYIDQTRCIFHNPNQTAKEAIQEYFGNLQQLKRIILFYFKRSLVELESAIRPGNKLHRFLKNTLPKGVEIILREW